MPLYRVEHRKVNTAFGKKIINDAEFYAKNPKEAKRTATLMMQVLHWKKRWRDAKNEFSKLTGWIKSREDRRSKLKEYLHLFQLEE